MIASLYAQNFPMPYISMMLLVVWLLGSPKKSQLPEKVTKHNLCLNSIMIMSIFKILYPDTKILEKSKYTSVD